MSYRRHGITGNQSGTEDIILPVATGPVGSISVRRTLCDSRDIPNGIATIAAYSVPNIMEVGSVWDLYAEVFVGIGDTQFQFQMDILRGGIAVLPAETVKVDIVAVADDPLVQAFRQVGAYISPKAGSKNVAPRRTLRNTVALPTLGALQITQIPSFARQFRIMRNQYQNQVNVLGTAFLGGAASTIFTELIPGFTSSQEFWIPGPTREITVQNNDATTMGVGQLSVIFDLAF